MGRTVRGALPTSLVLLALAACGKDQRGSSMQQAQIAAPILSHSDQLLLAAATIALPPAGVQAGDLPDPRAQGAQLEAKYCAQCHSLPAPTMHSATDWPIVVRRMWLRMEWLPDSLGIKSPLPAERYEILQYLSANALKVSGAVLAQGRGRDAFGLVCSRCHALPDPRNHSKTDWPIVFARMERNMERMKVVPPTADQTEQVLSYLEMAAAEKPAPPAKRD
jgi:cytochrome c5